MYTLFLSGESHNLCLKASSKEFEQGSKFVFETVQREVDQLSLWSKKSSVYLHCSATLVRHQEGDRSLLWTVISHYSEWLLVGLM